MIDEKKIQFITAKLPVTSLEIFRDYILIGQGGSVKFRRLHKNLPSHSSCSKTLQVFQFSSVHCLKVLKAEQDRNVLLCIGGRHFALYNISTAASDIVIDKITRRKCSDWILDGALVNKGGKLGVVFVLAHNSTVFYNLDNDELESCEEVHCSEKCILYSAKILLNSPPGRIGSWEDMVVCSGTVFNQIVVWRPQHQRNNRPVLPVDYIKGHDGVIFAIEYQPQTKLLFSASDDRSIRAVEYDLFSNKEDNRRDHGTSCAVYGHEARIWKLRSCYKSTNENLLISSSEDGFCVIWKVDRKEEGIVMKAVRRINANSNILSLALHTGDDEVNLLGLGSTDGSVRVMRLTDRTNSCHTHQASLISFDQQGNNGDMKDVGAIKSIALLDACNTLAHTDTGLLAVYNFAQSTWRFLAHHPRFSSYSCMQLSSRLVALGNTKGEVLIVMLDETHSLVASHISQLFQGKILSLTWSAPFHLLVSGGNGEMKWLHVSKCEDTNITVEERKVVFQLPNKLKWHTCSSIFTTNQQHYMVVGDRRGSIHLYEAHVPSSAGNEVEDDQHARYENRERFDTLRCLHGKHGATSINILPDRGDGNLIVTTGRDGTWRVIKLDTSAHKLQLLTTNRAARGMEWIEEMHVKDVDGRWYLCGFHGNKFVVWSRYSEDCLLTVECGGGHRSWSFSFTHRRLVYLKAGRLNVVTVEEEALNESLLESNLHSQQIQNVVILNRLRHPLHGDVALMATSSDDTRIKILLIKLDSPEQDAIVLRTLDDHISNVRHLKCLPWSSTSDKMMLLSCGSKSTLNLYQFDRQDHTMMSLRKVCDYTDDVRSEFKQQQVRFMMLDCLPECKRIAVARSDGRIETLELLTPNEKLTSTGRSEEHNNCFLTIKCDHTRVYAGSSEGAVRLFDWTCRSLFTLMPHQNGVNSIILTPCTCEGVLITTGGDDNSIVNSVVRCDDGEVKLVAQQKLPIAHSGQVSALAYLPDRTHFLSASIDQRLHLWQVKRNEEVTCRIVTSTLTHVADVSSMAVSGDLCAVAGCGISLYRVR